MNTKIVAGVAALILVAAGAYWVGSRIKEKPMTTPLEVFETSAKPGTASTSAPAEGATQGAPAAGSARPAVVQGAPVKSIMHQTLAFDGPTFTTSERFPTVSGTGGNVSSARILIKDSHDVGLETAIVPIVDGRWSYSSARSLTPGTYTVLLGISGLVVRATLVVQ